MCKSTLASVNFGNTTLKFVKFVECNPGFDKFCVIQLWIQIERDTEIKPAKAKTN